MVQTDQSQLQSGRDPAGSWRITGQASCPPARMGEEEEEEEEEEGQCSCFTELDDFTISSHTHTHRSS